MVDIDNAFLNGDLEYEIYMKIPEGYDEVINQGVDKEDCLILQKAIYGLVQAVRQFWKNIVDKMQEGGFKLSQADPCMLFKEDEKGVHVLVWFDLMCLHDLGYSCMSSPHRNAPHSCQCDVLGPWSLQPWVCQGSILKMKWSLSWSGSRKIGLFQKKILAQRMEFQYEQKENVW